MAATDNTLTTSKATDEAIEVPELIKWGSSEYEYEPFAKAALQGYYDYLSQYKHFPKHYDEARSELEKVLEGLRPGSNGEAPRLYFHLNSLHDNKNEYNDRNNPYMRLALPYLFGILNSTTPFDRKSLEKPKDEGKAFSDKDLVNYITSPFGNPGYMDYLADLDEDQRRKALNDRLSNARTYITTLDLQGNAYSDRLKESLYDDNVDLTSLIGNLYNNLGGYDWNNFFTYKVRKPASDQSTTETKDAEGSTSTAGNGKSNAGGNGQQEGETKISLNTSSYKDNWIKRNTKLDSNFNVKDFFAAYVSGKKKTAFDMIKPILNDVEDINSNVLLDAVMLQLLNNGISNNSFAVNSGYGKGNWYHIYDDNDYGYDFDNSTKSIHRIPKSVGTWNNQTKTYDAGKYYATSLGRNGMVLKAQDGDMLTTSELESLGGVKLDYETDNIDNLLKALNWNTDKWMHYENGKETQTEWNKDKHVSDRISPGNNKYDTETGGETIENWGWWPLWIALLKKDEEMAESWAKRYVEANKINGSPISQVSNSWFNNEYGFNPQMFANDKSNSVSAVAQDNENGPGHNVYNATTYYITDSDGNKWGFKEIPEGWETNGKGSISDNFRLVTEIPLKRKEQPDEAATPPEGTTPPVDTGAAGEGEGEHNDLHGDYGDRKKESGKKAFDNTGFLVGMGNALTFLGGLHANKHIQNVQLRQPALQNPYWMHRNVYGDFGALTTARQQAAETNRVASDVADNTSDAALGAATRLQAQGAANEAIARGNAADNARIRETQEAAYNIANKNAENFNTVANANVDRIANTKAWNNDVLAQRMQADYSLFTDFMNRLLAPYNTRLKNKLTNEITRDNYSDYYWMKGLSQYESSQAEAAIQQFKDEYKKATCKSDDDLLEDQNYIAGATEIQNTLYQNLALALRNEGVPNMSYDTLYRNALENARRKYITNKLHGGVLKVKGERIPDKSLEIIRKVL